MTSSKIELDLTDDEDSVDDVISRARALQMAVDSMPVPTEDRSPSSDTSIHEVVCDGKWFPPCRLGQYDIDALSCGLFARYCQFIDEASDAFQETKCLKKELLNEGLTPSFRKVLEWVIKQFRTNPNMAECNTLVCGYF